MDAVELAKSVFDDGTRNFAVELWDGSLLPAEQDAVPGSRVALCRPETLSFFLPPTSERRLAEAYIGGLLELRGDTCGLLEAAAHWKGPRRGLGLRTLLAGWHARRAKPPPGVAPLPRRHGSLHHERRDREAIRQHYDRAAELCALFLDESRTYSCAYFPTGNESLERAQEAKHELICRKLELEPRQRLLDIGCGWGAFMMHARSRYRVRVLGTTLSEEQFKYVERTISSLPPGPEIAVRLLDYRELDCESCFDKVSSVGMMEHVGAASLQHYFASVYGALRPGGLFLNHAIAALPGHHSTLPWMSSRGGDFIGSHIFPDGELAPIHQVVSAAEHAGFEVRDLESLREHYATTLEHWFARLNEKYDVATRIVGSEMTRAFMLYLAGSIVAFRLGEISVFQLLLAKRTHSGRAEGMPRCRGDWYR